MSGSNGIPKLVQGAEQDRNVFNNLKRTVRDMSKLTDEQIAFLHYESWHQAYIRSGGVVGGGGPDES